MLALAPVMVTMTPTRSRLLQSAWAQLSFPEDTEKGWPWVPSSTQEPCGETNSLPWGPGGQRVK